MSDNYSILQRNTLDGFSETAGILYLQLCDQFKDEKRAFFAADAYESSAGQALDYCLKNYSRVTETDELSDITLSQLAKFFSARWRNNFMGEMK